MVIQLQEEKRRLLEINADLLTALENLLRGMEQNIPARNLDAGNRWLMEQARAALTRATLEEVGT